MQDNVEVHMCCTVDTSAIKDAVETGTGRSSRCQAMLTENFGTSHNSASHSCGRSPWVECNLMESDKPTWHELF